jgi:DNA-cytosine methyltransferase
LLKVFEQIPPDGGDRRALPNHLQLASHQKLDLGRTPGFTDVYGRLRWDAPSVTITAKSRSPSSGRFLHPEQHRNISIREAALLQGFPHSYRFCGTPTQQYRQIGEAVPPLFARSVAWAVLESFRPRSDVDPIPKRSRTKPTTWKEADHGIKSVDLFCGAGGLSLGFLSAGFRPLLGCDSDAAAVATYERNLDRGVVADIGSAEFRALLEAAVEGQSFIAVGGPPCQGFSHQRRGHAHDPRNELVLTYADVLLSLSNRPKAIVLENVKYLDLPRGNQLLAAYFEKLDEAGYECFRHDLNSADFGVPQLRNRIIVVAFPREVAPYYEGPTPLTPMRWTSVGEAFEGLPEPTAPGEVAPLANHYVSGEGPENKRRIAFVDMGGGRKSIPPDLQLPCHATNYRGHRDVFGRLDWFSQARTLTSGFDSFTRGEYGHPLRHRSITAREAARIQGFPDWFEFVGTREQVRRQIGNAVPPPLAFAIAQAVSVAFEEAGDVRWAARALRSRLVGTHRKQPSLQQRMLRSAASNLSGPA